MEEVKENMYIKIKNVVNMVSRRSFLKGIGAGTTAKGKKAAKDAVNPVKQIKNTVDNVKDLEATAKSIPKGKQSRRKMLKNIGSASKRVAMKKGLPQKAAKSLGNIDAKRAGLEPYKDKLKNANKATKALSSIFSNDLNIVTFGQLTL